VCGAETCTWIRPTAVVISFVRASLKGKTVAKTIGNGKKGENYK
jgi:hypothetical protein